MLQVLYDLLSPSTGAPDNLQIVDESGVTVVRGLTQVQVSTEEEALALLFEGCAEYAQPCTHSCRLLKLDWPY